MIELTVLMIGQAFDCPMIGVATLIIEQTMPMIKQAMPIIGPSMSVTIRAVSMIGLAKPMIKKSICTNDYTNHDDDLTGHGDLLVLVDVLTHDVTDQTEHADG